MIYEYVCQHCGKRVRAKRSPSTIRSGKTPKYCSQACNGAARRGTGDGPTPNHLFECESCGEKASTYRSPSAPTPRFCSTACAAVGAKGSGNPAYTGGRVLGANGYIYALAPDHPHADARGYVLEHRLVMESALGRPLTRREVVHHLNRIKTDNRAENLRLMASQSEHLALHRQEDAHV